MLMFYKKAMTRHRTMWGAPGALYISRSTPVHCPATNGLLNGFSSVSITADHTHRSYDTSLKVSPLLVLIGSCRSGGFLPKDCGSCSHTHIRTAVVRVSANYNSQHPSGGNSAWCLCQHFPKSSLPPNITWVWQGRWGHSVFRLCHQLGLVLWAGGRGGQGSAACEEPQVPECPLSSKLVWQESCGSSGRGSAGVPCYLSAGETFFPCQGWSLLCTDVCQVLGVRPSSLCPLPAMFYYRGQAGGSIVRWCDVLSSKTLFSVYKYKKKKVQKELIQMCTPNSWSAK